MVPGVNVHSIKVDGNIATLTLSWEEPFNNYDPIVNYTLSCSGDVTCPPDFSINDNIARMYIYSIFNLIPMATYTFSVVATNSIGNGEAGLLKYTIPPGNHAQ